MDVTSTPKQASRDHGGQATLGTLVLGLVASVLVLACSVLLWGAGAGSANAQEASTQIGESVRGWGANFDGQLGDGSITRRLTPVPALGLAGVTDIAGGERHSLAVKGDGTAWAWGRNLEGQIGDGTTSFRNSPVRVSGLSDVMQVEGGVRHSLAIKADTTTPTVSLTSPQGDDRVGGRVALSADASDNVCVDRVEFLVNGSGISGDITAPYARGWDSGAVDEDTVRITARAYDTSGNFSSSSVIVEVDNVVPTVTGMPTGTRVSTTTPVKATFSEGMAPATVTGDTLFLKRGAKKVAAALSLNAAGDEATLTPSKPLVSKSTYTATVTTGAKDEAGNALAAAKIWKFTTR